MYAEKSAKNCRSGYRDANSDAYREAYGYSDREAYGDSDACSDAASYFRTVYNDSSFRNRYGSVFGSFRDRYSDSNARRDTAGHGRRIY